MAETVIRTKLTDAAIGVLVQDIEGILAGEKADKFRIKDTFFAAFAQSMFESIHTAFLEKSERGSDDLGKKWKPLKRATIAARPIRKGEKKALGITGKRSRGLLTKAEDRLWKGIFRSTFIRLAPRIGEDEAKAMAGKTAWAILKSRGAKTKLEVLGGREVPIGILTGMLERSLRPGKANGPGYRPKKDQIFRKFKGGIELGTAVPHSESFHSERPMWPDGEELEPWIDRATEAGVNAAVQRVAKIFVQAS